MTKMQADVSPWNTAMASKNSGWPPLSTMYTTLSVRMVSEESLGMLMSDTNSSSTSDDCSRYSSVPSEGALDDCPALAVAAALVEVSEVFVGCVAVDDWWVEAVGWSGGGWTGGGWSDAGGMGVGVDGDAASLVVGDPSLSR